MIDDKGGIGSPPIKRPEPVLPPADYEGNTWKFHKSGFEINQKGQLRTIPKG